MLKVPNEKFIFLNTRLRPCQITSAIVLTLFLLFCTSSQAFSQTDLKTNYTKLREIFQKMKQSSLIDDLNPVNATTPSKDLIFDNMRNGFAALSKTEGIMLEMAPHIINKNNKELYAQSLKIVSLLKLAKSDFDLSESAMKKQGGVFIILHEILLSEDSFKELHSNIEVFERALREFMEQVIRSSIFDGIIEKPLSLQTDIKAYKDDPLMKSERVSMVTFYDGSGKNIVTVINNTDVYAKRTGLQKEVIIWYAYGEDRFRFYTKTYASKNNGIRLELIRTGGSMYPYDHYRYDEHSSIISR